MKKTDKEKYFIACYPIQFDKLKGLVKTPNNEKYVHSGGLFQCLVNDIKTVKFKYICFGTPDQIIRPATKKELAGVKGL
jgi:hypothetical protein